MEPVYLTLFIWLVLLGLVVLIALPVTVVYIATKGKSNLKSKKLPEINRI